MKIAFTIENNENEIVDFDKTSQLLIYKETNTNEVIKELITVENTTCKSRIAIILADYDVNILYTKEIGIGAEHACIAYGSIVKKTDDESDISALIKENFNKKP